MLIECVNSNGTCMKDFEAFENKELEKVVYVPEYNIVEYEETGTQGYTYAKMVEIAEEYDVDLDMLFEMLDWQSPETLANEISEVERGYEDAKKRNEL